MSKISRKLIAGSFFALLATGAMASLAWACTGQSQIQILPLLVPEQRRATVQESPQGRSFSPGVIEIRWNGLNGPKLAEATVGEGQRLSAEITIPDVPAGVYYVLAVQGDAVARAVLEVMPASASPNRANLADAGSRSVSAELWTGFAPNQSVGGGVTGAEAELANSSGGSGASAGIALFATGFVALGAGAVVAIRSRRTSKSVGN